ncbi:radical SAM protein [Myxococcota bacterium]|nr:radical SAM protein [Myxococcota bacterium]
MLEQLRIEWEITAACPLSCPDCSSRQMEHGADLAFSRQSEVVDRLVAAKVSLVSLSGGEPLAHPRWEALARRLAGGGVAVQMLTSASVWDAMTARRMKDAGVGRVWLGIDATGAAHDRFRGQPGLWDRVVGAVADLRAAEVPMGVFTTVRSRTVHGLEALARWVRDNGVTDWFLWAAVSGDRTGAVSGDRTGAVSGDLAMKNFSRPAIERMIARTVRDTRIWVGDTWRPGEVACGAGDSVLGISSDGRVRGCLLQVGEPEVGHVLETELQVLAARARMLRQMQGCTACAQPQSEGGSSQTWQRAAMVPIAAVGTIAALALGATACRSNDTESLPARSRAQTQQGQLPPAEPTAKVGTEAEGKTASPAAEVPMRKMPNCCYSRALIRDCKCDWNKPVTDVP